MHGTRWPLGQVLLTAVVLSGPSAVCGAQQLPDAPSALLNAALADDGQTGAQGTTESGLPVGRQNEKKLPLCPANASAGQRGVPATANSPGRQTGDAKDGANGGARTDCRTENQIQPIVTSGHTSPLTSRGKAALAARDVIDPFNLITITAYSAIAIGVNSHSAYGPGL